MANIEYQPRIDNAKGRLTLLSILLCVFTSCLMAVTPQADSVCTYNNKVLFPKASAAVSRKFAGNQVHLDSIRSFLSNAGTLKPVSVRVTGSYSPEGKRSFNIRLAKRRARALADIIRRFDPTLSPVLSITHPAGGGISYRQQRFAELQVVYHNPTANTAVVDTVTVADIPHHQPSEAVAETAAGSGSMDTESRYEAPVITAGAGNDWSGRLFLTTNMLYDAALTPNIGVGMSVTDRITVIADWMYARWSNRDKRRYWRIYGGDIEARYRIGRQKPGYPLAGHHVGVYCSMACYDFQAGRSHKGVLSDKWNYAAGMSYTYSMPIATRLNIDFSLGVGYLWGTYKKHAAIDDCDVWLSTHKMGWLGPTRAGVSLVWLIGNSVANKRKGGGK